LIHNYLVSFESRQCPLWALPESVPGGNLMTNRIEKRPFELDDLFRFQFIYCKGSLATRKMHNVALLEWMKKWVMDYRKD
jgi:hypothetical protein